MKEVLLGIAGVLLLATVVFASAEFAVDSLTPDASFDSIPAETSADKESLFSTGADMAPRLEPATGLVVPIQYPRFDDSFKELWEEQGGLGEKFSEKLDGQSESDDGNDNNPCTNGAADCAPTVVPNPCANNAADLASCQPTPTPDPCASGAVDSIACVCKKPFASIKQWIDCICARGPIVTSAREAEIYQKYCTTQPTPTPSPTPQGGGETRGHDIFLGGGETGGVSEETPEVILLPQEKKNFLMVFADSMAYVGEQIQAKVVEMDSTKPIPGATVRVYREGSVLQLLTANENGVVNFPAESVGVLTYKAEVPSGLQQYNDPTTVIFTAEQIALQEESPQQTQPGGLTGLFTAVSGNWILVLLAALLGYAGYRNYTAKKK
ncbi:MAG: hypothetical protein QXR53_01975 [Candidatus Norongarragalinales archaeon]